MNRVELINSIISKYNYTTYLEIGTRDGFCFNQILLPVENKVGVDPDPVAPATHHMSSDKFFLENLNGFDIIFIDGDHTGEQVYVDLISALKVLKKTPGHIILHDCLPPTKWHTRPKEQFDPTREEWCGTVWKAMAWFRMSNDSKGYCSFTLNADWGLGVIFPDSMCEAVSVQKPDNVNSLSDLTYEEFRRNKDYWIGLTKPEDFVLEP